MAINEVGPAKSWRLVHNGVEVIMLEELSGITTTQHEIFTAVTEQECLDKIKELNLIPLPSDPPPSIEPV
jgi:hypothetical protein